MEVPPPRTCQTSLLPTLLETLLSTLPEQRSSNILVFDGKTENHFQPATESALVSDHEIGLRGEGRR